MNIYEYADALNLTLELYRYPNQDGRWTAKFEGTGTKDSADSGILTGTYGNGISPTTAVQDYLKEIRGKLLVIERSNVMFVVPKDLSP